MEGRMGGECVCVGRSVKESVPHAPLDALPLSSDRHARIDLDSQMLHCASHPPTWRAFFSGSTGPAGGALAGAAPAAGGGGVVVGASGAMV
jgi:inactivated superfamily I helicase